MQRVFYLTVLVLLPLGESSVVCGVVPIGVEREDNLFDRRAAAEFACDGLDGDRGGLIEREAQPAPSGQKHQSNGRGEAPPLF